MIKVGKPALDFTLPDSKGAPKSLFSLVPKDKPLLLVFYKNSCPTCQYTFPHLTRLETQVGVRNIVAVGQDSVAEVETFKSQYKFHFEALSDSHPYPVSVQYDLKAVPTLFVIEPDKTISSVAEGFDKKAIENFAARFGVTEAFDPSLQVPLLKPG